MPLQKLKELLDQQGVKYVTISHSPAHTAQEIAQSARVSGRELAKTVMIELDGRMAMAVVTAIGHVDLDALALCAHAKNAVLAEEAEFKGLFPSCEVGAMPPFGNLYGMPVYVSGLLEAHGEIAFNAGSATELVRMATKDFMRLVNPVVGVFETAQ